MHFKSKLFAVATALCLTAGSASAAVLQMLGDQDFADGESPILAASIPATSAGDPAPFNTLFGSDPGGSFGTINFTHNFAVPVGATTASIEIGLIDHDSFSAGSDTIDILFDGIAQDTSVWEGISINPSSAHVRSMAVDLALIADGILNVQISATASASGFSGNGIGVDFSKLSADVTGVIPLPASGLLVLSAVGLVALRRKRG